jgi:hypothetical protein
MLFSSALISVIVLYPIFPHVNAAGSFVTLSDSVKLLGVTLDNSLTFTKHANQVSPIVLYYHLEALRHIRHCLDNHTASLIAHALISSRFDYANSVLYGAPHYITHKLQRVQNSRTRIVLQSDSLAHSEPLLYGNFIGYLFTAEYVSNFPPLHIKPSVQTLLNISLRAFVIINQFVFFAPLTSTFLSSLHPPLTLVLVLSVQPLLSFGTQYHCCPYISYH